MMSRPFKFQDSIVSLRTLQNDMLGYTARVLAHALDNRRSHARSAMTFNLLLMSLEPADETVGGAVVVEFSVGLGEFRKDLLGELLTEFNTPLVVAVDVPDNALREKS